MKAFLFLLPILSFTSLAFAEFTLKAPIRHVEPGVSQDCALDQEGVKCWGGGPFDLPTQSPITLFSSAITRDLDATFYCAASAQELFCREFYILYDQFAHPPRWHHQEVEHLRVRNPRAMVLSTEQMLCVIDDEGLKCGMENPGLRGPVQRPILWASDDLRSETSTPPGEVTKIGRFHSDYPMIYAIAEGKVWIISPHYNHRDAFQATPLFRPDGNNSFRAHVGHGLALPPEVARFKDPVEMTNSWRSEYCLRSVSDAICWKSGETTPIRLPPLKNPKKLAPTADGIWILDDHGLRVVGYEDKRNYEDPTSRIPTSSLPRQLHQYGDRICVEDDQNLRCWGEVRTGRVPWKSGPTPMAFKLTREAFNPLHPSGLSWHQMTSDELRFTALGQRTFSRHLAAHLNAPYAEILTTLNLIEEKLAAGGIPEKTRENAGAYALLYDLLRPLISSLSSEHARERIQPEFEARRLWLSQFRSQLRSQSPPMEREIRLAILRAVIQSTLEFTGFDTAESSALKDVLRKAGKLQMNPVDDRAFEEFINQVRALQPVFEKLRNVNRGAFLAEMVSSALKETHHE